MHDPVANDGHMAAWNLNKVEFGSFGLVSRGIREVRLQNGERAPTSSSANRASVAGRKS